MKERGFFELRSFVESALKGQKWCEKEFLQLCKLRDYRYFCAIRSKHGCKL
jgi:hypothetical protein